jgi:hypothetical protein
MEVLVQFFFLIDKKKDQPEGISAFPNRSSYAANQELHFLGVLGMVIDPSSLRKFHCSFDHITRILGSDASPAFTLDRIIKAKFFCNFFL